MMLSDKEDRLKVERERKVEKEAEELAESYEEELVKDKKTGLGFFGFFDPEFWKK